jgi:hypothetical protein
MATWTSTSASFNDQRELSEVKRLCGGCPFCAGSGIITVYHPTFKSGSIGITRDGRRYATAVAAHCRCDAGNWYRERVPPELQARIPRVEDICLGRSRWLLIPPGMENGFVFPDRPVTREDFARLVKRPLCPHVQTPQQIESAMRRKRNKPEAGNVAAKQRKKLPKSQELPPVAGV